MRVTDNDAKLQIRCLAFYEYKWKEVKLARSSTQTLKLPRWWQDSRKEKDLEPNAKAFRHPGGEDGRGWYYRVVHASKKRMFRKDRTAVVWKRQWRVRGMAFSWHEPGGMCYLQANQRLFYCWIPGPIHTHPAFQCFFFTFLLFFLPFFPLMNEDMVVIFPFSNDLLPCWSFPGEIYPGPLWFWVVDLPVWYRRRMKGCDYIPFTHYSFPTDTFFGRNTTPFG